MKYKTRATRADEMPDKLAPEPQSKLSIHMVTACDVVVVPSVHWIVRVYKVPAATLARDALVAKANSLISK